MLHTNLSVIKKRSFTKFVLFSAGLLLATGLTVSAQQQDRMEWYRNSSFFINIDTYPRNFEAAERTVEYKNQIRDLIRRTGADMIYYHCRSQDGYAKYPTDHGIPHPELDGMDIVRIWRDVTEEMGVKFFAYYSYHMSHAELEAHPEFRRIDKNGNPVNRVCSNTDYVDTYTLPVIKELVTEYQVDGFWIDASIWAIRPCYCDDCVKGFRELYQALPPREMNDPMWLKFAEFQRNSFERQSRRI